MKLKRDPVLNLREASGIDQIELPASLSPLSLVVVSLQLLHQLELPGEELDEQSHSLLVLVSNDGLRQRDVLLHDSRAVLGVVESALQVEVSVLVERDRIRLCFLLLRICSDRNQMRVLNDLDS